MTYRDRIQKLTSLVSTDVVDFTIERDKASKPTQVSSEFLINKEQGDWAENTLLNGINNNSSSFIAVHYGKNDNVVAGEDGFDDFYNRYQSELDEIGKRPDLLIFKEEDFPYDTRDISNFSRNELDLLVPKALCGIEVRSSAFLIEKYEDFMKNRTNNLVSHIMETKQIVLNNYGSLLQTKDKELYKIIFSLYPENMHVQSFRAPSWRTTPQLLELSRLLKSIKSDLNDISKRTYLSITPKVEDLKVVYNWINRYGVPHFYVQVFFDKAYGISFERILELISKPELEGKEYFIEGDVKNQNKQTIKINASREANILEKVSLPEHHSEMKQLGRGRLLFYVKFKDSLSVINNEEFEKLFGFGLK